MIFKDKIKEFNDLLRPEMDQLFQLAITNQKHGGDLLLLYSNGFYNEDVLTYPGNYDPHVIGPGILRFSESTHNSFIDKYRKLNIVDWIFQEHLDKVTFSPDRKKEIDNLIEAEETTIQIELLIYLKFWEADLYIKKLYEFVRILRGEKYDWRFKISESNRDQNSTGTRQEIIRKRIRDDLKDISPIFSDLITKAYKTQIRNSISHSNYSIVGRRIHLNNFIQDDPASQLKDITFDDWIDIFHITLIIHNEYLRLMNNIHDYYLEQTKNKNYKTTILVDDSENPYELPVIYREIKKDWDYSNE